MQPTYIGPYQVLRRIGQGGMGVVYAAQHPSLSRQVAVKQLLAVNASERALERFLREADALSRVRHRGIVTVHQLGKSSEGPYLVEELIDGEPLSALVSRGPLDFEHAARLVRGVADALQAVHDAGLLHRDVKPQNVMVRREDGAPILLDFGLARDVDAERLTRTGELVGTVTYMAPEQASVKAITDLDARTDVYGLGVVLYELLTGTVPFSGSAMEVVLHLLTRDPRTVGARRPGVPAALDAICRTAMARDRQLRYASAAELRDDLDRFLRGERTAAEDRLPGRVSKRSRVVGIGAVVSVVALAVAGGTWALRAGAPPVTPSAATDEAPTVAAPAETPPATLWTVSRGDTLVYQLELVERGLAVNLELGAVLSMTAEAPTPDGLVPFACRVVDLRCVYGMAGVVQSFDSARPTTDPGLLSMLGAAKDQPFTCKLDPRTGKVLGLAGFDRILRRVQDARSSEFKALVAQQVFPDFTPLVFNDGFIQTSMRALTHVEGKRPVADGHFATTPGAPREIVLACLTSPHGPADRFVFEGETRYARGRLQRAELTQTRDGGEALSSRWSMTLR